MTKVTVEVLGCGDAFSSKGHFNTCYYVYSADYKFLIDCGATSLLALKKSGISTLEIDMIAVSHFHGDHFGGLPFFLLDAAVQGRAKPLTIISPPGGKEKVRQAIELFYPGSMDILEKLPVRFIAYEEGMPVQSDGVRLEAYPVIHSEETLPHGLRIYFEHKIVGFSGDTSWTDALVKIADQADLFICECNLYDQEVKGHLDYHTILARREQLACKKLWLTHFGEEMWTKADEIELDYCWEGKKAIL